MKKLIALVCLLVSPVLVAEDCVVLLHGLARVSDSMADL